MAGDTGVAAAAAVCTAESPQQRILIIEQDTRSVAALQGELARAGYAVTTLDSGEDARAAIALDSAHLVMLDWDLPGAITLELLRLIRRSHAEGTRLIALSKFSGEEQVVSGFERGIDDYVVKPFSVPEVLARVRAVLRTVRRAEGRLDCVQFRQMRMATAAGRFCVRNREVGLRTMEFRLLEFLMRHPERAFDRQTLPRRVCGRDSPIADRKVDVTIQRLRRALAPYRCDRYVQSVRGIGYLLSAGAAR